jgi:hypothetical protein
MRKRKRLYRVVSERHGLVWTGSDASQAEQVALMVAINTARTTYLQDGDTR